ncbi:hypothetical protein GQ600_17571 [Phytophthora cactorum]|nr:hypothetical protein GQ600_17571 [Phytophthora cactorum]
MTSVAPSSSIPTGSFQASLLRSNDSQKTNVQGKVLDRETGKLFDHYRYCKTASKTRVLLTTRTWPPHHVWKTVVLATGVSAGYIGFALLLAALVDSRHPV